MRSNQWGFASTLVFCFTLVSAATLSGGKTYAADECHSGPKGTTPQGKHWYYRIERPSKRQCWYLGDEGRKVSQPSSSHSATERASAPPLQLRSSAPAKAIASREREPMQPAVANARAELSNDNPAPSPAFAPVSPPSTNTLLPRDNPGPQTVESPSPSNSRFAERWPDAQTSSRVAQAETTAPSVIAAAPTQAPRIQETTPQQVVVPVSPTTNVPSAADDDTNMLRIALGILTAAIAMATIIGRMIVTHMRPRRRPVPRRHIWQTIDDDVAMPVRSRASETSLRARAEADVEQLLHALRYPEGPRVTSPVAPADRGRRPRDQSGARA